MVWEAEEMKNKEARRDEREQSNRERKSGVEYVESGGGCDEGTVEVWNVVVRRGMMC